jgi:hypothetical protein
MPEGWKGITKYSPLHEQLRTCRALNNYGEDKLLYEKATALYTPKIYFAAGTEIYADSGNIYGYVIEYTKTFGRLKLLFRNHEPVISFMRIPIKHDTPLTEHML